MLAGFLKAATPINRLWLSVLLSVATVSPLGGKYRA